MKTLLITMTILFLALNVTAQDIYSVGYRKLNNRTQGALYKNGEMLYTAHNNGTTTQATRIACNSNGDIFWLVYHYNYPSNTLKHAEIHMNDQIYASTEGHSELHINDMYLLNDTLYYVGYQLNEHGVAIATVWKGEDFTPHWVLGDGVHASVIYDAEIDKNTNIPYFCGYVSDSVHNACVWEASELLYKHEPTVYQRTSEAREISLDNGSIYTNGYISFNVDGDTFDCPTIWKDNATICQVSDTEFIERIYACQDDYYYAYYYPHGMYYAIYKNRSVVMLELPIGQTGVLNFLGDGDNIYMLGALQGQGSIWKNFEVYLQPNNCFALYDMVFFQTDGINDTPIDNGFTVYPNPTNGILFVETRHGTSLPDQNEYRITNLMGQTLLQGIITTETQQINIAELPAGMYFISLGEQTIKFVKQ